MINGSVETEPLETLAETIVRCANEADEKVLEAAKLIREARKRVESGEAIEGVTPSAPRVGPAAERAPI